MQVEYIRAGSVDVRIPINIIDASTLGAVDNTAGRGLTGLAFNTASLVCFYFREDNGNNVSDQLTLVTYTRGATHTDGGFVEQDATNSPGDYWLCLSDAMVAAGASWCKVQLKGAANMVQVDIKIILTDDPAIVHFTVGTWFHDNKHSDFKHESFANRHRSIQRANCDF